MMRRRGNLRQVIMGVASQRPRFPTRPMPSLLAYKAYSSATLHACAQLRTTTSYRPLLQGQPNRQRYVYDAPRAALRGLHLVLDLTYWH
jgi:hypothetical protein